MTETENKPSIYQLSEKRDEEMILAEMRGEQFLSQYVYSFKQGNREITSLSYVGIKEAIRRRGGVEILDVKTEQADGKIRALVKVRDLMNRIDVLGASEAEADKPFAYVLAVNKAERNAFAKVIPAKFFAELIAEKLGKKPEVARNVTPEAVKDVPLKDRLINSIRPDIMNVIEVASEGPDDLVLRPTVRLKTEDFKETCHIIEHDFNGAWVPAEGVWKIPLPKKETS